VQGSYSQEAGLQLQPRLRFPMKERPAGYQQDGNLPVQETRPSPTKS